MKTHIEVTIYGDSYIGCNVWRVIQRVECMDSLIEGTMYGDVCRGYNVWSLI